jgi:hypothetical protein
MAMPQQQAPPCILNVQAADVCARQKFNNVQGWCTVVVFTLSLSRVSVHELVLIILKQGKVSAAFVHLSMHNQDYQI